MACELGIVAAHLVDETLGVFPRLNVSGLNGSLALVERRLTEYFIQAFKAGAAAVSG